MNQLQIIHEQVVLTKKFKVYGTLNNPLFLAKDVAEWIEHSDTSKMIRSVDEDEKVKNNVPTPGGLQESWFLTEDGLYEVLMQSRKPIAKQFKKQVKNILKEIRIDGGYIATNEDDDEMTILAKGFLIAQKTVERQKRENEALHNQIEQDAPYTKFGKVVAISDGAINVGTYAKMLYEKHGINLGRNKLMAWLRENGYLIKQKGAERNLPKQKYIENGWFRVRPAVVARTEGDMQTGTPLITGKGQVALADILLNEFSTMEGIGV
ncbi:phage antirepressor KilAC domain-containing protein [Lysinibacillus boronitolerans]|uniref:phage antirepressor n=1 Tax=Lysinibacillus boronitolerans TaxID=309788 RepID=UPI0021634B5C|nr:phage antirepressor KilAC domain-containing protein [Lysinibacillus boronitolerans]MCS1394335.1 phage antirepressor KilAC domain-containing protein [Lysinibacillus boronitolerans]